MAVSQPSVHSSGCFARATPLQPELARGTVTASLHAMTQAALHLINLRILLANSAGASRALDFPSHGASSCPDSGQSTSVGNSQAVSLRLVRRNFACWSTAGPGPLQCVVSVCRAWAAARR